MQESFTHDPDVQVLLATDAAGEGINLQRAHLMVNYDLPWNPNRLEQRFGRIHRIGQTEVCHLWNLVAEETREGEVYHRLLEKLEQARARRSAARSSTSSASCSSRASRCATCSSRPSATATSPRCAPASTRRSTRRSTAATCADLLEDNALARDSMDASRVFRIREEMERAEARRLQPHYIAVLLPRGLRAPGRHAAQARAAALRDHPRARRRSATATA